MKLRPGSVGAACVAMSILLWGMNSVVMRLAVRQGLTPAEMTALRYVTAALLLLPFALRRPRFPVGHIGWTQALVLFTLAGAPYNLVVVTGAGYAPALDISALVFGVMPIATAATAWAIARERVTAEKAWGLTLVLAGILPFTVQAVIDGWLAGGEAWRGHLLFAIAGAMWGAFTTLSKRWRFDPWEVSAAVAILSALSLPLWIGASPAHMATIAPGILAFNALYMGALVGVASLMFYQRAVQLLGPLRAGMSVALVPFVTWIGGELVLGEAPAPSQLAGMVLVVAGLAVASHAGAKSIPAQAGTPLPTPESRTG